MFHEASAFTRFIRDLPEICQPSRGDHLELVINGDFIDFLAEKPFVALVRDEATAVAKLDAVLARVPEIVAALRDFVGTHSLAVVLGNHDLELGLPAVRNHLLCRLAAQTTSCRFLLDGEAYRRGELLIEHGNRYDPWNVTDQNGMRSLRSVLSRGEFGADSVELSVCAGSQLVADILNPLKSRYRFLDVLQPQDATVALMLRVFRPDLVWLLKKSWHLAAIAQSRITCRLDATGRPTRDKNLFSADRVFDFTPEECVVCSREIASLSATGEDPGASRRAVHAETLPSGQLSPDELSALQALLRKKMDRTGPDTYSAVASGLLQNRNVGAVVFGHTHKPCCVRFADGTYINTGTWTSRLEIPGSCLEPTSEGIAQLSAFVAHLRNGTFRNFARSALTFAHVTLSMDGRIITAELKEYV
jgi:UDP-2,3-diacylglucosamine pyrophosphatase LpxH